LKVCDLTGNTITGCHWLPKNRKIEGSNAESIEQLVISTLSACLAVIPGIGLVLSHIIRNERFLFSMLEAGKFFIVFDLVLLVVGCMEMDRRLTS